MVFATVLTAVLVAPLSGPASTADVDSTSSPGERKVPVIRVFTQSHGHRVSPYLTGVNQRFYRRGSVAQRPPSDLTASGAPDPRIVRQIREAGITLLRYPGGTAGHFFDWTKAIGPQARRGCQINGKRGHRVGSSFGPDEQQALVNASGAKTQIMVPFLRGTAGSAANWVEYMNNPVSGPNINGGVDWAARRAAYGHPKPYGITRWEVGNEPFFLKNRRWLPDGLPGTRGYRRAMRIYSVGGTVTQSRQPVGGRCSQRPHRAVVTGTSPNPTFAVYYPPVKPFPDGADQRVWVGGHWSSTEHACVEGAGLGETWREVDDLSTAGPQERVYTFGNLHGKIRFGNGRQVDGQWQGNALIPPMGSCVWAAYRSGHHDGFRSYYYAMKHVDAQIKSSNIDVCSAWGREGWPYFAAQDRPGRRIRYDCLITHPYRILGQRWTSAAHGYAQLMVSRGRLRAETVQLSQTLDRFTPDSWHPYLAASEYGVIAGQYFHQPTFPPWKKSLMVALYNVTQIVDLLEVGVPWAEGGMLLTDDGSGIISGPPDYYFSALARGLQVLRPVLSARGHTLRDKVIGNPTEKTRWGSYPTLVTAASKSSHGDVFVLVINRDPRNSVTAKIAPTGFRWTGRAGVWRMNGPSFKSTNTASHPNRVRVTHQRKHVGKNPFRMTFGEHSVTVVKLNRRR